MSHNLDTSDEGLTPSSGSTPFSDQAFPDSLGKRIPVPQDMVEAGMPTNLPRYDDSPESLDDDITSGADRERIDPHHSTTYNKDADSSVGFVEDN